MSCGYDTLASAKNFASLDSESRTGGAECTHNVGTCCSGGTYCGPMLTDKSSHCNYLTRLTFTESYCCSLGS